MSKANICDSCKEVITNKREKRFDGLSNVVIKMDLMVSDEKHSRGSYGYDFCGKCSNKFTRLLSKEMGI